MKRVSRSESSYNPEKPAKGRNPVRSASNTAESSELTGRRKSYYKTEGQSPIGEYHNVEMDTRLRHLRDVCHQLGVGNSDLLRQSEFLAVCAHIGVRDFREKELEQLFTIMDTDKDGLISMTELINGLPQSSLYLPSPTPSPQRSSRDSSTRALHSRNHSHTRRENHRTPSHNMFPADFTKLFSSVETSRDGYAKSEDVIDLLERLGVNNGADILQVLGFSVNGQVNLSELSAALEEEMINSNAPEAVYYVAVVCFRQEIRHLKWLIDQAHEENKKLKLDLSESNAHNALLAREVDERHSQLDKSWEFKLLTVECKYQEQVKNLQTEVDEEREASANQVARLRRQLEEIQNNQCLEEQAWADNLAHSQKVIIRLEKELADSSRVLKVLSIQNENLKKDFQHKLMATSPTTEDDKLKVIEQEQLLERKQEENKKLKDENDELIVQLEQVRQKLQAAERQGQATLISRSDTTPLTQSHIPVLRSSVLGTDEDETSGLDSARSLKQLSFRKSQQSTDRTKLQHADYHEQPSLSKELSQYQSQEVLEREKRILEQKQKMEMSALAEKNELERAEMLRNFEHQKEHLTEELERREKVKLEASLEDLKKAFAREKENFIHKHESEMNSTQRSHRQDIKALQERLKEAETCNEATLKMENLVQTLEAQLVKCHSDLQELENQKSDFDRHLKQQEVTLRQEFEEEKQKLIERFIHEFEQKQINQLDQLFSEGADALTGKLREDFMSLVSRHTEDEVGKSQVAILNQLQKDRSDVAAAWKQEKSKIYEEAEQNKLAMVERYETQIFTLRAELLQQRSQLEEEKQKACEIVQKSEHLKYETQILALRTVMTQQQSQFEEEKQKSCEAIQKLVEMRCETQASALRTEMAQQRSQLEEEKRVSCEAVQKSEKQRYETQMLSLREEMAQQRSQLEEEKRISCDVMQKSTEVREKSIREETVCNVRQEMKEEQDKELTRMKENYELEKRELETLQKLLGEKLTELQDLLDTEIKKSGEIPILKESIKSLRGEKREMEGMVESMKEKLFQVYQQKGMEQTDLERKLEDVRSKSHSTGKKEGREEGQKEGLKEGYDNGFTVGKKEGKVEGFTEGQQAGEAALVKVKEDMQSMIQSLRHEKSVLEKRLKQEKEKGNKLLQEAEDKDTLKASYDLLLGEKHALELKYQESYAVLEKKHQSEKDSQMKEIQHLETQRQNAQSDKQAIEAHIGALQQELNLAKQAINEEESGQATSRGQMTPINYQLQEAQQELGLLKEEYEALLQGKAELEETVRNLKTKTSEGANIKTQMAQIKTLSEEKRSLQALLDQTSEQLVKTSTSMALAQCKFIRELEAMKQKAKSLMDVESYTQLQINLVEQQRIVITLQDAIRERESLIHRVIKEGEEQVNRINQIMDVRVKDFQNKLDYSQEQLLKEKEKYKQLCTTSNRRILVMKDLYVEKADLMMTLANSEIKRRLLERHEQKLMEECAAYKKTIDRLCNTLSR